ncbi:MAG: cytochrome c [Pseudomonadota bacterium]
MKKPVLFLLAIGLVACGKSEAPAERAAGSATESVKAADSSRLDPASFNACAVCHMPDGNGVQGAFPPIRERMAKIAKLDGGREYLVVATKYGMTGTITIDGVNYSGLMSPQGSVLNDAALAGALNYGSITLAPEAGADLKPFTESEVAAISAALESPSISTASEMRRALVEKHGELWP